MTACGASGSGHRADSGGNRHRRNDHRDEFGEFAIHLRLSITTSFTASAATADALLDQGVVFDMSTV